MWCTCGIFVCYISTTPVVNITIGHYTVPEAEYTPDLVLYITSGMSVFQRSIKCTLFREDHDNLLVCLLLCDAKHITLILKVVIIHRCFAKKCLPMIYTEVSKTQCEKTTCGKRGNNQGLLCYYYGCKRQWDYYLAVNIQMPGRRIFQLCLMQKNLFASLK